MTRYRGRSGRAGELLPNGDPCREVSSGEIGDEPPSEPKPLLATNGEVSSCLFSLCAPRPRSAALRNDPFLRLVFCCCTTAAIARLALFDATARSLCFCSGLRGVSA